MTSLGEIQLVSLRRAVCLSSIAALSARWPLRRQPCDWLVLALALVSAL